MANQNNITQDATGTPAIVTILATPHALIKCCSCGTPCGIHCAVGLQNLQNLRTGTRNTSNQGRISRSSLGQHSTWLSDRDLFLQDHDEVSDGEDKEREREGEKHYESIIKRWCPPVLLVITPYNNATPKQDSKFHTGIMHIQSKK